MVFLFYLLIALFGFANEDISGFWKTIDSEGDPQCILAIYEYDDLYYGRIIGIFNEKKVMDDHIYSPKQRAARVVGNPYYCGLDIIWGLVNAGVKYKGKILDPEKGNIYSSELWMEDDNLIVRGKYLIFGRSSTWYPVVKGDFPDGFKEPDLSALVPSIPEINQ